jgi:hypothetical protein
MPTRVAHTWGAESPNGLGNALQECVPALSLTTAETSPRIYGEMGNPALNSLFASTWTLRDNESSLGRGVLLRPREAGV